jgi:hypothetical protein
MTPFNEKDIKFGVCVFSNLGFGFKGNDDDNAIDGDD